jgi:hypothetical protein
MELCSGLIYDKEGWKTTWINKIGLMQPSEAYGEDTLGGIFRERPYQLGGNNTTYGRIWLWGDCFLAWQTGSTEFWLFILDEGPWEVKKVLSVSPPLPIESGTTRETALLKAIRSTMLGFEPTDRGKAKEAELWDGLPSGGASWAPLPQASMLGASSNDSGVYAAM